MDRISPKLKDIYQKCRAELGEEDPYSGTTTIGIHDVLRAHFLIADYFYKLGEGIGGVGFRDAGLLHSAMTRQFTSYAGKRKWNTPYEVCATLFYGLNMNHAFHDSNKRTAFLIALYHLQKICRTPRVKQKEFEDLTVAIASHSLSRYKKYSRRRSESEADAAVYFIAEFLKSKTRDVDRRFYCVTYSELNNLLKKFGCLLDNPRGNFIDVFAPRTKRKYLGIAGPKETYKQKVGQIGFPGWKTQVNQGALRTVRTVTGLTPENDIDSERFFHDAEPLQVLIETYHGPLKRLADK